MVRRGEEKKVDKFCVIFFAYEKCLEGHFDAKTQRAAPSEAPAKASILYWLLRPLCILFQLIKERGALVDGVCLLMRADGLRELSIVLHDRARRSYT